MKINFARNLLLAGLFAMAAVAARADEEQDQIAILHSNASLSQKWKACQTLRVIGTDKAVPEVAALLTDPKLSQAARQTLGGLPYPDVDTVLADALGKTSGLIRAGIIDSIGWREKPESVAALAPFLADSDTNVAAAAATALGHICGADAAAALSKVRDDAPAPVQFMVLQSLLECAQKSMDNHDMASAAAIYRDVNNDKYPVGMRTAGWRGLILSDADHRAELMTSALMGSDAALKKVAIRVLRDSTDASLIQACAAQWTSLPMEAQLAVLDVSVKQGDASGLAHTASQSPDADVRLAAWKAMGDMNDLSSLTALAHAAATSQGDEQQAARDSLARLHGPGASEAITAGLNSAGAPEKAELLRALGAWHDPNSAKILVEYVRTGDENERQACLDSLTQTAPPDALAPLMDIAQQGGFGDLNDQGLEALSAICRATPDKQGATKIVIDAEGKLTGDKQGEFLPLLAQLGTADGLAATEEAGRSQNVALARQAMRALAQWPNAGPAEFLIDTSRSASDKSLKILALRGAIAVAAMEPSPTNRLSLLKQAMAEATRPDEKIQVLSQFGNIPDPQSLQMAMQAMSDPDVSHEAALASLDIAEKIAHTNPQIAHQAAARVLAKHHGGDLFQRAWALQFRKGRHGIPFIEQWQICGPYAKQGVIGALALFDLPFGPEAHGTQVEWKPAHASDNHVALAEMFPGAQNCVVYLRATVVAPRNCSAVLLTGSDDGIKAWLNGAVVQARNVDRPDVVDDDAAPISLKKGPNELLCKITQGGGGWSACARIVGTNGKPIKNLKFEVPGGAAGDSKGTQ